MIDANQASSSFINNNNNNNNRNNANKSSNKINFFNQLVASNQLKSSTNAFSDNWEHIKANRPNRIK